VFLSPSGGHPQLSMHDRTVRGAARRPDRPRPDLHGRAFIQLRSLRYAILLRSGTGQQHPCCCRSRFEHRSPTGHSVLTHPTPRTPVLPGAGSQGLSQPVRRAPLAAKFSTDRPWRGPGDLSRRGPAFPAWTFVRRLMPLCDTTAARGRLTTDSPLVKIRPGVSRTLPDILFKADCTSRFFSEPPPISRQPVRPSAGNRARRKICLLSIIC